MTYMTQSEADEISLLMGGPATVNPLWVAISGKLTKASIKKAGCPPPPTADEDGLLSQAQAFFMLEMMQKNGKIQSTTGEIAKQVQGKVSTEMQRLYPLFFFGGSDDTIRGENIATLLSHMTYWQLANWMISLWCEGDIDMGDSVTLSSDTTSRGAGWQDEFTDVTSDT